jgi:pyroglutamyl-peptidase
MTTRSVLVTGFEPFGGMTYNPSAEIALTLNDAAIAGHRVVGRLLAVDFARNRAQLAALLEEIKPLLYIGFGLATGEDMIRIERYGVNLADFVMPDNAGAVHAGREIEIGGPAARSATLPCAEIRAALLAAGIPARLSNSAGSYLCNANLYTSVGLCAAMADAPRCGFIHLPYASHQVATLLQRGDGRLDGESLAPSLPIETMIAAARVAVETAISAAVSSARPS